MHSARQGDVAAHEASATAARAANQATSHASVPSSLMARFAASAPQQSESTPRNRSLPPSTSPSTVSAIGQEAGSPTPRSGLRTPRHRSIPPPKTKAWSGSECAVFEFDNGLADVDDQGALVAGQCWDSGVKLDCEFVLPASKWGEGGPGSGKKWDRRRTQRLYEDARARKARLEASRKIRTQVEAPFKPSLAKSTAANRHLAPRQHDDSKTVFERLASLARSKFVNLPNTASKSPTATRHAKLNNGAIKASERLYAEGVKRLKNRKLPQPLAGQYTFQPARVTKRNSKLPSHAQTPAPVVDRLYNPNAARQKDIQREEYQNEQVKRYSFKPRLMTKRRESPSGTRYEGSVVDRLYVRAEQARNKIERMRKVQSRKELEQCTFSPSTNVVKAKGTKKIPS